MIVLGFDPGLGGAVSWLNDKGEYGMFHIPIKSDQFSRRIVDAEKLARFLKTLQPDYICIEQLGMYGEKGRKSIATSGQNWGRIVGLIEAMKIPFYIVDAKKWQRELGVKPGDEDSKIRIHRRAVELFPNADFSRKRQGKYEFDDGKVDSIMLAKYALKVALQIARDKVRNEI